MTDIKKLVKVVQQFADYCKTNDLDLNDVIEVLEIILEFLKVINPSESVRRGPRV